MLPLRWREMRLATKDHIELTEPQGKCRNSICVHLRMGRSQPLMGMMDTDMEGVRYHPISVYQVHQWLNTVFLFFRDFRVVRG